MSHQLSSVETDAVGLVELVPCHLKPQRRRRAHLVELCEPPLLLYLHQVLFLHGRLPRMLTRLVYRPPVLIRFLLLGGTRCEGVRPLLVTH